MLSFLHWFEEVIENLGKKRTVIDATEGGAAIKGTEVLSFRDTLDRFCQNDLTEDIRQLLNRLKPPSEDCVSDLVPYLNESRITVTRLTKLCEKGTRWSKALLDHYEKGKPCNVEKMLRRLDAIDKFITETRDFQSPFHYVIHPIVGSHANSDFDTTSTEAEIARQSYHLYNDLNKALNKVLPLMTQLIRSLETKKHEADPAVIQAV